MKKRIMAIALCLLLCLPLVFTSCGNKFVDSIASTGAEEKTSYTKVVSTNAYKGDIVEANEFFIYTTQPTEDNETIHRVYSVETGKAIYTETVDNQAPYRVPVTIRKSGLFSTETVVSDADDNSWSAYHTEYALYDKTASKVLTEVEDGVYFCDNFECEAFITNNALYFYEDGVAKMVKSFRGNEMRYIVNDLIPAGDRYVYIDDFSGKDELDDDRMKKIVVFNSSFEQIDVQPITPNFQPFYSEEDAEVFPLNNGNILVQVTAKVGEYKDVFDADYDYVDEGDCYILDTYLYNVKKLNYKEIKLNYIISDLITLKDYVDDPDGKCHGFVNNAENRAYAHKIDDESIVYGVNNESSAVFGDYGDYYEGEIEIFLTNDGKAEEFEIIDEGNKYEPISDTRYIVFGDHFARLYNEKNKVLGEFDELENYNKNFLVTDYAIIKTSDFTEVVAFDDDQKNYEYVGLTVDSAIIKEISLSGSETYYLITESGDMQKLEKSAADAYATGNKTYEYQVFDYFYCVVMTDYEKSDRFNKDLEINEYFNPKYVPLDKTYTFYTTDGVEISSYTYDIEDEFTYSVLGEWNDTEYLSFKSKNANSLVILGR